MADYQIKYTVTVNVTADTKTEAKQIARDLLDSADSGWADCSLHYTEGVAK